VVARNQHHRLRPRPKLGHDFVEKIDPDGAADVEEVTEEDDARAPGSCLSVHPLQYFQAHGQRLNAAMQVTKDEPISCFLVHGMSDPGVDNKRCAGSLA
jgi:hypothetical protein